MQGDVDSINLFRALTEYKTEEEHYFQILKTFLPCPTELTETVKGYLGKEKQEKLLAQQQRNIEKYGYPTWYEWCCEVWGCKWSDCDTELYYSWDNDLSYTFSTPWSPPIEGIQRISLMYPTLYFVLSYQETGMGYVGANAIHDGYNREIEGDYSIANKWYDEEDYESAFDAVTQEQESCEKIAWSIIKEWKETNNACS